jgi:hypothetical protein
MPVGGLPAFSYRLLVPGCGDARVGSLVARPVRGAPALILCPRPDRGDPALIGARLVAIQGLVPRPLLPHARAVRSRATALILIAVSGAPCHVRSYAGRQGVDRHPLWLAHPHAPRTDTLRGAARPDALPRSCTQALRTSPATGGPPTGEPLPPPLTPAGRGCITTASQPVRARPVAIQRCFASQSVAIQVLVPWPLLPHARAVRSRATALILIAVSGAPCHVRSYAGRQGVDRHPLWLAHPHATRTDTLRGAARPDALPSRREHRRRQPARHRMRYRAAPASTDAANRRATGCATDESPRAPTPPTLAPPDALPSSPATRNHSQAPPRTRNPWQAPRT